MSNAAEIGYAPVASRPVETGCRPCRASVPSRHRTATGRALLDVGFRGDLIAVKADLFRRPHQLSLPAKPAPMMVLSPSWVERAMPKSMISGARHISSGR